MCVERSEVVRAFLAATASLDHKEVAEILGYTGERIRQMRESLRQDPEYQFRPKGQDVVDTMRDYLAQLPVEGVRVAEEGAAYVRGMLRVRELIDLELRRLGATEPGDAAGVEQRGREVLRDVGPDGTQGGAQRG